MLRIGVGDAQQQKHTVVCKGCGENIEVTLTLGGGPEKKSLSASSNA
jgi:hypothetical protein